MITGIILGGGDGKRLNSKTVNKVSLPFLGKPMIEYGVELLEGLVDRIVIVVGAYDESVREALKNHQVEYAHQEKREGTAHATKIAMDKIESLGWQPDCVFVGYGDHMMFYKKETINKLKELMEQKGAVLSMITAVHDHQNELAWGRIIRDANDHVVAIVEQKDATEEQRIIKELNAGFYCFDYAFLKENIDKVEKSPVTGEYYLPDMVKIAVSQNKKVAGLRVPFGEVGIGVNTENEMQESTELYREIKE
jgi:bifunctional UDP-N-acetylglucosamine pyrophosphorylase / glucosamine-1-phosphate N-acetyltransferase